MRIADRLRSDYAAEQIILFGSVARGEATEHSDLDLLVIAASDERQLDRRLAVRRLVRDLTSGIAFSPIVLTPVELQHRLSLGDQFIAEIVAMGRRL